MESTQKTAQKYLNLYNNSIVTLLGSHGTKVRYHAFAGGREKLSALDFSPDFSMRFKLKINYCDNENTKLESTQAEELETMTLP